MNDCLFCKIAAGEIPSTCLYNDDDVYAFRDINPQAPVHILVVPKAHIASAAEITPENSSLCAHIFEVIGKIAKEKGAKFVMSCYPVALALLKTPAECGADVAAGEGQPLGLPLAFGGPYLGFLTCRENLMRKLTGRIVGETVDHDGRPAYVLTLQAREQHIRREKSTSSICSNEALCALTSSIYLAAMGKEGLKDVAKQCVSKAHYMKDEIVKIDGFRLKYDGEFFNEFVIESDVDTSKIVDKLQKRGILAGLPLSDKDMLWCVTEMNTKDDIDEVVNVLREVK